MVVVSGSGNNGGDAFVAARHLMNNGVETDIFLVVPSEKLKGEAKANHNRAEKVAKTIPKSIKILSEENLNSFKDKLEDCQLIIDGIFGIGLEGPLPDPKLDLGEMKNILER